MDESSPAYLCPRCRVPLTTVRTSHGIYWSCAACDGRAVTVEQLRRTFTAESVNPLWRHAITATQAGSLSCPSCAQPMLEVDLSENATVRVDVCRHCHFVWFDAQESETLTPLPAPKSETNSLSPEARQAIAMVKVEALAEQARGTDINSEPPDEWWQVIAGYLGMPVEYDTPASDRRPWATWLLSLVVTGASALAFPHLHQIANQFGLVPAQAGRFYGATLLTSFFLHADLFHLLGNMYFLVVFGRHVESFLGWPRYLILIFLSAIAGDLAHIVAQPSSQTPCIGASGGISGVIMFNGLAFPNLRLGFLLRWIWWIRLPAWFALVLWIGFQMVGAWEELAGISRVAAFAHLGGALTGLVAWLAWRKTGCQEPGSA